MFKELFHLKREGESEEEKRGEDIEWYEGNKSHLKKGVRPIMACVETREQLEKNPNVETAMFSDDETEKQNMKEVDYYGRPEDLNKQNFKNAGYESYVISTIDDSNKFSKSFKNCTGLVVSGVDKETGKNISFISHEDPGYFLDQRENKNRFVHDLEQQLREFKERSDEGTIDAVIVGGNYFKSGDYRIDYLSSIELLSDEISKVLGFKPLVMTGPKTAHGSDSIFFENENKRLYIVRPEVGDKTTESYMTNELDKQKKKWPIRD